MDKIEPCPFCNDPMEWADKDKLDFTHVNNYIGTIPCPVRSFYWPHRLLKGWNTREGRDS